MTHIFGGVHTIGLSHANQCRVHFHGHADAHSRAVGQLFHLGNRLALLSQFRPDCLPIVRAKLLARYCAFGDLLDRCAMLYRDRALRLPVCDGLLRDAEFADNERTDSMLVQRVFIFHADKCTPYVYIVNNWISRGLRMFL